MADYRVRAPEVEAPSVYPMYGVYQDGYGTAINKFASNVADAFSLGGRGSGGGSDLAERRFLLEQEGKYGLAASTIEQLDISREEAVRSLAGELGIEPDEQTIQALLEGKRTDERLQNLDIQRPGKALTSLRRIAKLREQVAANPMIAQELMTLYKTGSGRGALQAMDDVTDQTEDRRAGLMEYVDTKSRERGLDMNLPIEERAALVQARDREVLELQRTKEEYEIYNQTTARNADDMRRDMARVAPGLRTALADEQARLLKKFGANPTPEQRNQMVEELDQWWSGMQTSVRKQFNNPDLTTADFDAFLAPTQMLYEAARTTFSTDGQLQNLKNVEEFTQRLVQSEIMNRNPELRQAQVLLDIMKDLPASMQEAAGSTELGLRYADMLETAFIGQLDSNEAAVEIKRAIENPQAMRQFLDKTDRGLRQMATNESISDQDFSLAVGNLFSEFDPNNTKRAQWFHNQLPSLASPEVLDRLGKMPANVKRQVTDSLDMYVAAVVERAAGEIASGLNPRTFRTERTDETGFNRAPLTRFTFVDELQPYIDIKYTDAGVPIFTVKPDAPEDMLKQARGAADKLNRLSPQIKSAVDIYHGIGLYTDRPKAALAEILLSGQTPDRIMAEDRKARGVATSVSQEASEGL